MHSARFHARIPTTNQHTDESHGDSQDARHCYLRYQHHEREYDPEYQISLTAGRLCLAKLHCDEYYVAYWREPTLECSSVHTWCLCARLDIALEYYWSYSIANGKRCFHAFEHVFHGTNSGSDHYVIHEANKAY